MEKMLMNPVTGSIDTEENWKAEMAGWETGTDGKTPEEQFESLEDVSAEAHAQKIMENEANQAILEEFFTGIASCDYYDGSSYQLYLDMDDLSFRESQEASSNTWMQRDDGSLAQIFQVSGYCDIPEDERYTDGCDLSDYGYSEWLDQIREQVKEAIENFMSISE